MKNIRRAVIVVVSGFSVSALLASSSIVPVAQTKTITKVKALSVAMADVQQSAGITNLGIYGGNAWDIAVDGDHVYTIAEGVPNGFFYSADAAATWQRPAGTYDFGSGRAVEVDLTTHAVYVALDGLYKSTDYGVTLTKIHDSAGLPLLFAQEKLFATWNSTVYVSADSGTTFTTAVIAADENIMGYAASPTAGTFYAVTRNDSTSVSKLYKSTDSGATWAAVTVDSSVTGFTNVAVKPLDANFITLSNDNYLWSSADGGTTWTSMNTAPDPDRSCGNFSLWNSSGRWYACAGYSDNDGAAWTDIDTHTNVMRGPGKIVVINPANESVLYGDCMSGVCKSTDGGLTWQNSLNGIVGVNVLKISQTTNKSTVWISSSNGLGRSANFTDPSPTWTWPILPCDPSPSARCDSSGIGESVWVKPDDANIVLAGSIGGWIYRSTDGTAATPTWTAQIPSVVDLAKFKTGSWNNLRPQHFINDPMDPNTVYVAIVDPVDHIGAVLKSIDAGITWTDLGILNDAPATVLAMSKTGVLYAGTGEGKTTTNPKGVYKYENGSWTKLTGIDTRLNINSVVVDPEVQTTVYATASNDLAPLSLDGFYKSVDSGATWIKIVPTGYLGFGAITVQKSTTPNTLYMSARDNANHGALLKSSDQGATWGLLYQGLKSESFTTMLFDGLVAGNKHGVFSLKSRGAFVTVASAYVRANKVVTLSTTLKDKATKKILKNVVVELQRKDGKVWKTVAGARTDKKGKVSFKVKTSSTKQYRFFWKPSKNDNAEYTSAFSNNAIVTIKKK